MAKKLLTTGYPGWLSQRLLEILRSQNNSRYSIRCMTEPCRTNPDQFSDMIEVVTGDLLDPESLHKATEGIEIILHTAGVLHVKRIREFYEINTIGTQNLLRAGESAGVKQILFISSNAAHGPSPNPDRLLEENSTPQPLSHYGKSKRKAEEILLRAHQEKRIESVILRPCMFYGPPVPARHIEIFRQIQKGWFPIFGHGKYMRSIVYIDNLVQAVLKAMEEPKARGQTYFIADRKVYETGEIIREMANALGVQIQLVRLPEFLSRAAFCLDQTMSYFNLYSMPIHLIGESLWNVGLSIKKAEHELSYNPAVEIKKGYARTMEWCRSNGVL